MMMKLAWGVGLGISLVTIGLFADQAWADDLNRKPIEYAQRQGDNPVSRLQKRLTDGSTTLNREPKFGYLPALLRELQIDVASQSLVFSKTSLQRHHIRPDAPRAIYFNEDIYVGFCAGGELLEISVADSELGTEYYSLAIEQNRPKLQRETEACLVCHGTSATRGFPGHLLRSVYVDQDGQPLLAMGSHRQEVNLPWMKRFGGWYVSGPQTQAFHLGNLVLKEETNPDLLPGLHGQPVPFQDPSFDASAYLVSTSDLVAQLLLAHQVQFHNHLAKLTCDTRIAIYDEQQLNRELKEPILQRRESTARRIRHGANELVRTLFFANEIVLPPLQGESTFAAAFREAGIRDAEGRSLRQLNLEGRLMEYRCSYLIYSSVFAGLPPDAFREVLSQMRQVLDGSTPDPSLRHLPLEERVAIDQILQNTFPPWNGAP